MTIRKSLAYCGLVAILGLLLAGCAYDTASPDWDGPYAADGIYDDSFYDGFYGPGIYGDGFGHFHRDGSYHHPFHHEFHAGGFSHFHSGGIHIAHAGGFGGHGRG